MSHPLKEARKTEAIHACETCGAWSCALELLEQMLRLSLEPQVQSWNCLVTGKETQEPQRERLVGVFLLCVCFIFLVGLGGAKWTPKSKGKPGMGMSRKQVGDSRFFLETQGMGGSPSVSF